MSAAYQDFDRICRTCLGSNEELVSIHSADTFIDENRQIRDVIATCASVQITHNDRLPQKICIRCIQELHKVYLFRQIIKQSECILRKQLAVMDPYVDQSTSYEASYAHSYNSDNDSTNEETPEESFQLKMEADVSNVVSLEQILEIKLETNSDEELEDIKPNMSNLNQQISNNAASLREKLRRSMETPEQHAERLQRDNMRANRKRTVESEWERDLRRYKNALRTATKRLNESEEEKLERRMKGALRERLRRLSETEEQREARLKAHRERTARSRMLKKLLGVDKSHYFTEEELAAHFRNVQENGLKIVEKG